MPPRATVTVAVSPTDAVTQDFCRVSSVVAQAEVLKFRNASSKLMSLCIADDADDDPTEDLLIQRLQTHEKYAWMLRSLLQ